MGKLYANGINAGDLSAAVNEIITDWNATMALLDADTGVTATNYVATCAMTTYPSVKALKNIDQETLLLFFNDAITKIAACTAKLDADDLTDSDYAATIDITDIINPATHVAHEMFTNGVNQGDIIYLLYTIKTNINALQAKLVADATVQTATYASANPIAFTIDKTGV